MNHGIHYTVIIVWAPEPITSVILTAILCQYLDSEMGTPPTDCTHVAPNALAIVPILFILATSVGNPNFDIPETIKIIMIITQC